MEMNLPLPEFVRSLGKYHPNGTREELSCMLEFSAKVTQRVPSAPGHQTELGMVVRQAQEAAAQIQTVAPVVGRTVTAANDVTALLDTVTTTISPWLPLLNKMKIFVDVMDGIAEVYYLVLVW